VKRFVKIANLKMKITYNITRFIVLSSLAIWIICIAFNSLEIVSTWRATLSTRKAIVSTIPNDYLSLFNVKNRDMIKNGFTEISSVRPPVTRFDYDDNKYFVIVTKVKNDKDLSLLKIIQEKHSHIASLEDNNHFTIAEPNFDYYYLANKVSISHLLLTLDGNSMEAITKGPMILSYYLKMSGFSIAYNKSGVLDLVGNVKGDPVPICLSFLKRNNYMYVILLSVNYNDNLQPGLLNSLLTSIK